MTNLLKSSEAAKYLGYAEQTLRMSRSTNNLGGVPTPKFIKLGGKSVRYKKEDLDQWISEATQETK